MQLNSAPPLNHFLVGSHYADVQFHRCHTLTPCACIRENVKRIDSIEAGRYVMRNVRSQKVTRISPSTLQKRFKPVHRSGSGFAFVEGST